MKPIKRIYTLIVLLLLSGINSCTKDNGLTPPQVPVDGQNLLQVLQNNFQYSLFYYAVKKTGLDNLLRGPGPLTIFVPDDNCFAAVGLGSQKALDGLDQAQLKSLLLYHMMPQTVYFKDVPPTVDNVYTSVNGYTLYLSEINIPGITPRLTVNGHYCKQFDVTAVNGVIQVLESKPLNLPLLTVKDMLLANPSYSYFVAGLQKFGLFDVLGTANPVTVFAPVNAAFDNNGISLDSVKAMDTTHFKKYLFGCYMINPDRMFLSDFSLLATTSNAGGGYAPSTSKDGILIVSYPNITVYDPGGLYQDLGGYANFISSDSLASNGVLHQISDLLVYPQNMQQ